MSVFVDNSPPFLREMRFCGFIRGPFTGNYSRCTDRPKTGKIALNRWKSKKTLYLRRHALATVKAGTWRNGRVVDRGGLENRCPGDWTGGSNPSFSAAYNTGRTASRRFGFCFHGYTEWACSWGGEMKTEEHAQHACLYCLLNGPHKGSRAERVIPSRRVI